MNQICQPLVSASEASILLNVTYRAVTKACFEGRLKFETVTVEGVEQYRIHLSSLSPEAQAKYWIGVYHDTFLPTSTREQKMTWFLGLKLDPKGIVFGLVYKAIGLHISPEAWTEEESEKRHDELFHKKTFAKETSRNRAQLLRGFVAAKRRASDALETQAGRDYAESVGWSYSTLAAWHKQVKHLPMKD